MSKVIFVGAGPVGCVAAAHFKEAGHEVEIFERLPDIRTTKIAAGKSFNLELSKRGISAIEELGMDVNILKNAVPMHGRMIHAPKSKTFSAPYGIDERYFVNSISRAELNRALLDHVHTDLKIPIHFSTRVTHYNVETATLTVESLNPQGHPTTKKTVAAPHVIASDGAPSALRPLLTKHTQGTADVQALGYSYKELTIPSLANHEFQMEKNYFHIWPRGNFMLTALPNIDGSFTCSLFLPDTGRPVSFDALKTPPKVLEFFEKHFPDAAPLIQNLESSFFQNPTGFLATVSCHPWHVNDQILLIGDAAHGIVPFFGQGLNCGLEDCSYLKAALENTRELLPVFEGFSRDRKANTDAIAQLSLENFIEMRDKVSQDRFILEKEIERELIRRFPKHYFSRYFLVTFSRIPYELAQKVGFVQDELLNKLSLDKKFLAEVDMSHGFELITSELEALNQEVRKYLG